jgi:hypothetical protein
LLRDALDILGECHFLLKLLKILRDGIGLHYPGLLTIDYEGDRWIRMLQEEYIRPA